MRTFSLAASLFLLSTSSFADPASELKLKYTTDFLNPDLDKATLFTDDIIRNTEEIYGYYAHKLVGSSDSELMNKVIQGGLMAGAVQFSNANSTFFGHEMLHWSYHGLAGASSHYFRDATTNEKMSSLEFYLKLLLTGRVSGPAVSLYHEFPSHDENDHIHMDDAILSGVNNQTEYAKEWYRQLLISRDSDYFDYASYFVNKTELLTYSLYDLHTFEDGDPTAGDIGKFVNILKSNDNDVSIGDVAKLSALSTFLSPMMLKTFDLNQFNNPNDIYLTSFGKNKFTYDLNNFMYTDGLSLDSTIYLNNPDNKITYFASFETPVVGDLNEEFSVGFHKEYESFDILVDTTHSKSGNYFELKANIPIIEKLDCGLEYHKANGSTLKHHRKLPFGDEYISANIILTF